MPVVVIRLDIACYKYCFFFKKREINVTLKIPISLSSYDETIAYQKASTILPVSFGSSGAKVIMIDEFCVYGMKLNQSVWKLEYNDVATRKKALFE